MNDNMTKREAIELVERSGRCKRCRWLAARRIISGRWRDIDASTLNKASQIYSLGEPPKHD